MRWFCLLGLVAGLHLPLPSVDAAEIHYQIQSLAKENDVVDSFRVTNPILGAINDRGDVCFTAEYSNLRSLLFLSSDSKLKLIVKPHTQAGDHRINRVRISQWLSNNRDLFFLAGDIVGERMFCWADGKITPFLIEGDDILGRHWLKADEIDIRLRFTPLGDSLLAYEWDFDVFLAGFPPSVLTAAQDSFLWDHQVPDRLTDLTPANTAAYQDAEGVWQFDDTATLYWDSNWGQKIHYETGDPVTNNRGEIAFFAWVEKVNAMNRVVKAKPILLFRDQNGQHYPVVTLGQVLADGKKVEEFREPRLNDAGTVIFRVRREEDDAHKIYSDSLYEWRQGQSAPAPFLDLDPTHPERQPFYQITDHWLNRKNRNVLLRVTKSNGDALYLLRDGEMVPQKVAVVGQPIVPGGPIFTGIAFLREGNDAGEHLLLASVHQPNQPSDIAAYLVDSDGQLTPVLQNGMTTELGKVEQIGVLGAGPNSHGQFALDVQIRNRWHVLLLTPTVP